MSTPKSLPVQPPVTLDADTLAWLDKAPKGRGGPPSWPWTPELDAVLLEARRRGVCWRAISERLGCDEKTARKRWRKLTEK